MTEKIIDQIPKTQKEFDDKFLSEQACRDFLFQVRWPEGFKCKACKSQKAWINSRNLIVCANCGYQSSLTSGTVMHGTKKPIRLWLKAIWWICNSTRGGSAKELQSLLSLGSYQTAWVWMQKLRKAMIVADFEKCRMMVELGIAAVGGAKAKPEIRFLNEPASVVGVVELKKSEFENNGRINLAKVPDNFSKSTLEEFIKENIETGTTIITNSDPLFQFINQMDFIHEQYEGKATPAHLKHHMLKLKNWLMHVHKGAIASKHLQNYLDEYTFRNNIKGRDKRINIFLKMLQGSVSETAKPYWQLVGRANPDTPLSKTGE